MLAEPDTVTFNAPVPPITLPPLPLAVIVAALPPTETVWFWPVRFAARLLPVAPPNTELPALLFAPKISEPEPWMTCCTPLPPNTVALPEPPATVLAKLPPIRLSLPLPATRTSLAALPIRLSLPELATR